MSSLRRGIVRGVSWTFGVRAVNAVVLLIVNALMTRILKPEDVGLYFLAMSMVTFATYISSFGLHLAVVKLLAESLAKNMHGRARNIVKKVMFLAAGNGTIVFFIMAFGGLEYINRLFYDSDKLSQSVILISLWALAWAMQMTLSEIFRGFHDIKLAVIFRRFMPNACFFLFLVGLMVGNWDASYELVFYGSVASWVSSCCVSTLLSIKKTQQLKIEEGDVPFREILKLAWPLGFASVFTLGMMQADIWILGSLSHLDDLAIYGVVVRILRQVIFPLVAITATIQPLIVSLYTDGNINKLQTMLRATSTVTAGIGLLVLIWALVLGEWTLAFVFGPHYASGAGIFVILSVNTLFLMIDGSNQMALMMMGFERLTMWLSGFYAASVIMGGILFVPRYGAVGMAWVMTGTSLLRCFLHAYFLWRRTGITTLPSLDIKWIIELIRSNRSPSKR